MTSPATPPHEVAPPPAVQLQRRFWRLTALNILANLTVPLTGLVDTGMLGHLPDIRFLAGVALAGVIFDTVYWSLGFVRMGATGLTAQAVGASGGGGSGDREDRRAGREGRDVYLVLYRSLLLALGMGGLLLLFAVPLRELGFALLSGEPGVEAAGREYFMARIWAAPAVLANFAFLGWYLGREESGRALVMTMVANLGNVGLNYLFIIRLDMAARGAGLATMLSQYAMLLVALAFFAATSRGTARGRAWTWRWAEVVERVELRRLTSLNGDILVRSLLLSGCLAFFTNASALLGTTALAANTILMRLFLLATYMIDGPAYATESLTGIFAGAGDGPSFRRLVRLAMGAGLGLAVLYLTGALLFQAPILELLTSHADVQAVAQRYILWLIPVLIFGAMAFIYDGIFIGLTAGQALRNSMLLAALAVFLPIAGAAVALESIHGLWLAMAAFMVARTATLGWMGRRRFPEIGLPGGATGGAAVAGAPAVEEGGG